MKVMFVMLRTLGDVVMSTTLVHELKKLNPNYEISFYTNKPYGELLQNNPDIFEVKESGHWFDDMIYMEMASGKYEKVFAPYQVRRECNGWHQDELTRHQHLVDFYWKRMGQHEPITERECYLYPSASDFEKAGSFISTDVPRIAIHTTTGVPSKDWPYFQELVEELRKAGYGCVQIGAREDKKVRSAVDLTGKMSLLELTAFLSKCAAFVGLDSGISYMADTMKVPTLVIQGSTNPITSGPYSERVIHLFAQETGFADCQTVRCHSNCRHEMNCNTKITVTDVLDTLETILASWKQPIPVSV